MNYQKEIFTASEADQWFERNRYACKKLRPENDLLVQTLTAIEIRPKQVLEIGCANGSSLELIHQAFGSRCFGIDPSAQAIEQGRAEYPHLRLQQGTADTLPFEDRQFDLVVFGFCLYLCDRADLFRI